MSFSFSHQFHRHWLAATKTAREEIKQELKDIIALLEPKAGSGVVAKKQQELDLYSPTGVTQRAEQDNQHHLPEAVLVESADVAVANLAKTAAEGADKPQPTPPIAQPTTIPITSNNASITHSPAYLNSTHGKSLVDNTKWLNDVNRYVDKQIDKKVTELKAELNQWLTQQLKQHP